MKLLSTLLALFATLDCRAGTKPRPVFVSVKVPDPRNCANVVVVAWNNDGFARYVDIGKRRVYKWTNTPSPCYFGAYYYSKDWTLSPPSNTEWWPRFPVFPRGTNQVRGGAFHR